MDARNSVLIMTACIAKNKCYIFLAASFLTCLLLVPRNIFPGESSFTWL